MVKLTILATIKDEQLNLPEWIEYHSGLGFSKFYLIEDFNSTDHSSVLNKYPHVSLYRCDNDKIDITDTPRYQTPWRQVCLYNRFFNVYPEEREDNYCLFLDVDEFLSLPSIQEFNLNDYVLNSKKDVFFIPMKTFNANGRIFRPSIPTPEAYTHEIKEKSFQCYGKTMINVGKDYHFSCIQRGNIVGKKGYIPDLNLTISHYFTKSWEDWLIRMRRGSQDPSLYPLEDFFRYNDDLNPYRDYLISNYRKYEMEWLKGNSQFLPPSYKDDLRNLGFFFDFSQKMNHNYL